MTYLHYTGAGCTRCAEDLTMNQCLLDSYPNPLAAARTSRERIAWIPEKRSDIDHCVATLLSVNYEMFSWRISQGVILRI